MLSNTQTRRTPPSGNKKRELPHSSQYRCFNGAYSTPAELSSLSSDFPIIATADDYHWNLNGTDTAAADWDITEGMVKMRINGDDLHGKMRTPPKSKPVGQEGSPLETSSNGSLDSNSPSNQHLGLPSHSRGSSADSSNVQYVSVRSLVVSLIVSLANQIIARTEISGVEISQPIHLFLLVTRTSKSITRLNKGNLTRLPSLLEE